MIVPTLISGLNHPKSPKENQTIIIVSNGISNNKEDFNTTKTVNHSRTLLGNHFSHPLSELDDDDDDSSLSLSLPLLPSSPFNSLTFFSKTRIRFARFAILAPSSCGSLSLVDDEEDEDEELLSSSSGTPVVRLFRFRLPFCGGRCSCRCWDLVPLLVAVIPLVAARVEGGCACIVAGGFLSICNPSALPYTCSFSTFSTPSTRFRRATFHCHTRSFSPSSLVSWRARRICRWRTSAWRKISFRLIGSSILMASSRPSPFSSLSTSSFASSFSAD